MSDSGSPLLVRQYFEHPPLSHLYIGSPTGSSPVVPGTPSDALPGQRKAASGVSAGAREGETVHAATAAAPHLHDVGASLWSEVAPQADADDGRQTLSTLQLTGLMYTLTISGAYGIEESVMGGGVMLTIVSILIIPVVMGAPTALIVAELAAAVPSNAGFLMWIKLSFHRTVYLAMAILSVVYIATDNALYPTMFSDYVCATVTCSDLVAKLLRLGMLALTFVLNECGVEAVGIASVVLTVLTVLPFVLMFLQQQLTTGFYVNWPAVAYVPTSSIDWPTFLATVSWCLSGLEQAGSVVEDVRDPQRTIIQSILPLICLALITYIPPILTGASVSHDPIDLSQWKTGYWAEVSYQVGGNVLKAITVGGGMLSALGLTLSALCTTTRILAGMALTEAFPGKLGEWLSYRTESRNTYPSALALNTLLTALFATVLEFDALVRLDQCLYGIRVIMIFASFYRIRHLYPHLKRPFTIPLKGWMLHGTMGIAVVSFAVLTVVSALEKITAILCTAVVGAAFLIAFVYCHYCRRHDFLGRVVTEFVEDSSEVVVDTATPRPPAPPEPPQHGFTAAP